MSDLISRQAAIEAVAELASSMSVCISVDECHGMKRMQGMAVRALDDLPSVQPQSTMGQVNEAVQSTNDCISRQAAIDFIDAGHLCNPNEPRWSDNEVVNFLKSRPSAQPQRMRGKWIDVTKTGGAELWKCSECGELELENSYFCPNCGSDMRGEDNESSR